MTEFMRLFKAKVEEELAPVKRLEGEEAPTVRTALRIQALAEEAERELQEMRVTTAEAAELTGWHPETLHARARAKLDGKQLRDGWEDLVVKKTPAGYEFVLGSIPKNLRMTG